MAETSAEPGWYPVDDLTQRYWDGSQWTEHTAPRAGVGGPSSDDKTYAVLAHVLTFVVGFVAPLVIFLIKKDESPYVRHHAAQALNFHLSVLIYALFSVVLVLLLIGLLMLLVLAVGAVVFTIIAAINAANGEWYRYPLALPFVR